MFTRVNMAPKRRRSTNAAALPMKTLKLAMKAKAPRAMKAMKAPPMKAMRKSTSSNTAGDNTTDDVPKLRRKTTPKAKAHPKRKAKAKVKASTAATKDDSSSSSSSSSSQSDSKADEVCLQEETLSFAAANVSDCLEEDLFVKHIVC